ncbi:hypothetical protein [Cellulosilyticum sp. WCF-2]|uniref:hypothetical protein n=1 Tax=Cellulosilyticum sp. WCF-2 TaxID=2497860 RepID=UPI000F8EAF73|nr:hypothetical protein [Cellulosilyticum sp. WCF-2]QEH69425.1 hypothetical protein EKH84_13920 [Cellulosilyticum sp. WCF-2]
MHKLLACYMKKKLGRCPYEILMQISDDIERLKKARNYLNQQYVVLINQMEQMQFFKPYDKGMLYLDGYSWGNDQENLGVPTYLQRFSIGERGWHSKVCSFCNQNCEAQLLAKKSMKSFLSGKLTVELHNYNDILYLYESIMYYHQQQRNISSFFVRFSFELHHNMAFYYPFYSKQLDGKEINDMVIFEKSQQKNDYQRYQLRIKKENAYTALEKTGELYLDKRGELIQLCQLISWMDENSGFKLKCLYELLKEIKEDVPKVISIYGKLDELSEQEKKVSIQYFRKEGFKILGAFQNETQYESENFIYRVIEV